MDDEQSLHDSVARGDVETLKLLLQKDPSLLNRVSFTSPNKIPLHVATMQGDLNLVKEILNHDLHLAEQFNSQQSLALHIASAKGNLEIVKVLSDAARYTCFSRDSQGMNPLHLAAVKGHVPVLNHLLKVAPGASREKVDGGVNLLHLCVKHNQLEALEALFPDLNWMINESDYDRNTALHMAVRENQIETIRYLARRHEINVHLVNCKGERAIDILKPTGQDSKVIRNILESNTYYEKILLTSWLTQKSESMMVVAVLIATMAFQAGVTPPGGVWQDDKKDDPKFPHRAGEAIIASIHPRAYTNFLRCNTVALISSLANILFLLTGMPFQRKLFRWYLMANIWLSVISIGVTYGISVLVVTPHKDSTSLAHSMGFTVAVWSGMLGILIIRKITFCIKLLQPTYLTRRFTDLIRPSVASGQGNV